MPAEQFLAVHSDAHTGATNKASAVKSASAIALAGCAREGMVSVILWTSRYAAAFEPSSLIRRMYYFTFPGGSLL
jgi:hypothetical protein